MATINIISPVSVTLPRKTKKDKKIALNMNIYRNLNFMVNNQMKVIYHDLMQDQLGNLKLKTPIDLRFTLYKGQNRKSDRANVLSIVEKFFCDALVEFKCIPDDNDDFIRSTYYETGGVDRSDPRVEIVVCQSL